MLVLLVTAYGVGAAAAGLLQVRQLLERRRSCEVSALFFAVYAGGYALWLAYGVSIDSLPLVIVDATGVLCATLTLAIALSLRGSLLNPATWKNCPTSRTALRRRVVRRRAAQSGISGGCRRSIRQQAVRHRQATRPRIAPRDLASRRAAVPAYS